MEKRDGFKSSFGVLVALTGSAVGLGNLWRFPYLVGTNGGAAFIIIYLIFVFVLCLPIMISEFIIGRRSQANVFGAFKVLAPKSKWGIIGILGVLASIAILSFYGVVGGWTIDYLVRSISFNLTSSDNATFNTMFQGIVTSTWEPTIYLLVFLVLTGLVVVAGVEKGIERYTKIMMPVLFFMIIIIAIRSLTLPGASAGVSFLFNPDFSKITFQTALAALGQAFFSLSLGAGMVITYSSYVKKDEKILRATPLTAISDTTFAIIAGLAIMPAVFAFGISPSEGPGLVFIILPQIFSQITGGSIIAILFFFILFFAALTSSISLLEVVVAYIKEEFHLSRKTAVMIGLSIITVFGVLCSLSQGPLKDVKLFGLNFFDFFDSISANVFMPICGLLVVIFVGWRMKKSDYMDEISNGGNLKKKAFYNVIYFIIRYAAPIVIVTIMVFGLIS